MVGQRWVNTLAFKKKKLRFVSSFSSFFGDNFIFRFGSGTYRSVTLHRKRAVGGEGGGETMLTRIRLTAKPMSVGLLR